MRERTGTPHLDESGLSEDPEVARRVCDRKAEFAGKVFDAALALGYKVQHLEALGARERCPDASQFAIEFVFKRAVVYVRHAQLFN